MSKSRDERVQELNAAFGPSGWESKTHGEGWRLTHDDGSHVDIAESQVEEPFIPYVHMLMVRHRQGQGKHL